MTNNSYLIYGQSYWVLADYCSWKIPQYHDYFLGLRIIDITLHKRKIYVWWNALTRNFIFHFKAQNSSMTLTNEKKPAQYLHWLGFPIFQKYGKYDISSSINLSFLKSDIFSVKISFLVVCYRYLHYIDIQIFPGS